MKISVVHLLQTGDISPLRWGMSAAELAPVLGGHPLDDWGTDRRSRHTLLNADGVEFYFAERRQRLQMLLIAAWRLDPDASSSSFDFGWLHHDLTLEQMRQQLDRLGWPYEPMHDPINPEHPVLVLGGGAWCVFEGEITAPRLQKVLLGAPDTDLHRGYARLVRLARQAAPH